jgi:hypothetical protein
LLEQLLLRSVLHFATGHNATRVAENIDRVVGFVGAALALSVCGIVASLVVTAFFLRRQRT